MSIAEAFEWLKQGKAHSETAESLIQCVVWPVPTSAHCNTAETSAQHTQAVQRRSHLKHCTINTSSHERGIVEELNVRYCRPVHFPSEVGRLPVVERDHVGSVPASGVHGRIQSGCT